MSTEYDIKEAISDYLFDLAEREDVIKEYLLAAVRYISAIDSEEECKELYNRFADSANDVAVENCGR